MYIEKIKIDKFRVLEDIEIRFQTPNSATADSETGNVVNVIAGVNGTGKTTLLECIRDTNTRMQTHPLSLNTMMPSIKAILTDKNAGKIQVIPNDEIVQQSNYLSSQDFLKNKKNNKGKKFFCTEWVCPEILWLNEVEKNIFVENFTLYEDKIIYFEFAWFVKALQADSRSNILEYVEKTIVAFVLDAERESDKPMRERTVEAVGKFNDLFDGVVLNTKLKSIERVGIDYKVIFSSVDGRDLSLKELSDGEKSLYLAVGNLIATNPNGKVIIFDEPEVAIHPAWQQKITQIFSQIGENNQFIVATHSPQIIASVPYQHLIILRKENGKIVSHYPDRPPIGADVNSILDDFMGVKSEFPDKVVELHKSYREKVEQGLEKTEEAEKIRTDLLQYESNDSRFMQEMRILMRLRGKK